MRHYLPLALLLASPLGLLTTSADAGHRHRHHCATSAPNVCCQPAMAATSYAVPSTGWSANYGGYPSYGGYGTSQGYYGGYPGYYRGYRGYGYGSYGSYGAGYGGYGALGGYGAYSGYGGYGADLTVARQRPAGATARRVARRQERVDPSSVDRLDLRP